MTMRLPEFIAEHAEVILAEFEERLHGLRAEPARGIRMGDIGVIVTVSIAYFFAVGLNTGASWARVAWTGRVGQNLMYHLRVRIFSHFQRLSVDFFTKEKAGVLMTRMTSDLESLTQLFQEGLVQMVVQGLTMIFVAGVLFYYNVTLALITMVAIIPAMLVLTMWFTRASDRGYDEPPSLVTVGTSMTCTATGPGRG